LPPEHFLPHRKLTDIQDGILIIIYASALVRSSLYVLTAAY